MAFITAETRSSIVELAMGMLNQAPSTTTFKHADREINFGFFNCKTSLTISLQPMLSLLNTQRRKLRANSLLKCSASSSLVERRRRHQHCGHRSPRRPANCRNYESQGFVAVIEFLANPANADHADLGDIAQSFQNRADAAEYFVVTKELGGSTDAELAAAIASVTSDAATLTAANTAADATASAEEVVAGQTFTLTTGLDTLTGASTNDTFSAVDSGAINSVPTTTLNSGDSINAGAGTDRLSIVASTGSATTSAQVASSTVEEVAVYNNSAAAYAADTTLMTGLTDLFVVAGINDVSFTGVNSSTNVHLTSVSNDVTVTNAATVGLGDADAVTIALNGAAATAASTLTYNDIETFNVVTSGAATGNGLLPVFGGRSQTLTSDQLETVNVSGSAAANITATMAGATTVAAVGTLDASDMTGALTATVGAGASGLLSVTGGAGADTLYVNSGAMNSDLTIDGGAGVDTLVVTSAAYSATSTTGQAGDGVTNMEVLLVAGSADLRSFSNNTFAGLVSAGAASIAGLGADAVALTMTAAGNQTLDRATDGTANAATVSFAGTSAFTVASLNVADEETVTINSGSVLAGSNAITSLVGTDLTSLTIAGSRDLTISAISGTKLATVDASGLSGLGTVLDITASNSTADMTVTGAAGVESSDGEVMNDITTGSGADAITTGDYAATISAGNGDNTVVAGDGDNTVTVGKDENTITVGDGDNGITAGNGDNTITVGGIATSVNSITVGNGDNTITSGAGVDTVTLGTGDDTVDTGAGADKIYMGGYDDDDVIDGGTGTDTLSSAALSSSTALAGAQIQPVGKFIDLTPGTSKTSSPAFTAVENVYMDVNLATANVSAATGETVDFAASSGISNLYLNVTDANDGATTAILTLSDVDAAAIHLVESGTTESLGSLVIGGTGQASLTVKGHAVDGTAGTALPTALTVTAVDALTVTSYIGNALVPVTDTEFGKVLADDSDTVTVTMAATTAALAGGTLTLGTLSADAATTIALNAGSNNSLVTGAVSSTSDSLETITATVSDDGTLTVPSITSTAGALTSVAISLGVNSTATFSGNIDVEDTAAGTITVGAASTLTAAGLMLGGSATTITGTASSTIDIDTYGKTAHDASTVTITGRGDLTNTFAIDGDTTVSVAGWTDTQSAWTVTTTGNDDLGFISNASPSTVTVGNGDNTVTTGAGADTIINSTFTETFPITFVDADVITVTVNGVASAAATASTDDATSAAAIAAKINLKSATNFAVATVDANDDLVITYTKFTTGATFSEAEGATTVELTVGAGALAGISTGANSYTTGDGADAVMGSTGISGISLGDGVDTYTSGGGADTINTGGNDSGCGRYRLSLLDAADVATSLDRHSSRVDGRRERGANCHRLHSRHTEPCLHQRETLRCSQRRNSYAGNYCRYDR